MFASADRISLSQSSRVFPRNVLTTISSFSQEPPKPSHASQTKFSSPYWTLSTYEGSVNTKSRVSLCREILCATASDEIRIDPIATELAKAACAASILRTLFGRCGNTEASQKTCGT